jgi:hypothetical protein
VSISAGRFVTIGANCILGIKDKPTHISFGDDYVGMLRIINQKYFVMCDVEDRRSWLVSGASAVLHVLRASIRHDKNDDEMCHLFIFDEDELVEASDPYEGSPAAFKVLSDFENNLDLPCYRKPVTIQEEKTTKLGSKSEWTLKRASSYVCFKDRVSEICHILGLIMAHQDNMDSENGVGFRLKSTPRRQLEGFEFMDLATGKGTLWPKVHTLGHWGSGWVDFTRAIHAVTLFGRGFGDLLQPSDIQRPCNACNWHKCLPRGRDYLASSTRELTKIIKSEGSMTSRPLRVVDNIYWCTPDKAFESCHCSTSRKRLHDRVQVLVPPKLVKRGLTTTPPTLPKYGAVIFGHSKKYPLRWPDDGDPEEGQPEAGEDEHMVTDFHDSGIGTSTGSSITTQGESTAPKPRQSMLYMLNNAPFIHYNYEGKEDSLDRGIVKEDDCPVTDPSTHYRGKDPHDRKGKRPVSTPSEPLPLRYRQRRMQASRKDTEEADYINEEDDD